MPRIRLVLGAEWRVEVVLVDVVTHLVRDGLPEHEGVLGEERSVDADEVERGDVLAAALRARWVVA